MKVLYYTTKWYNRSWDLGGHCHLVQRDYVAQTVFTKERFYIKYALAEAATDKRFSVELLKWRSEEIFLLKKNLAACIVDGAHTIKTCTCIGLMKWNTYQGHEFEKPFTIVSSKATWRMKFMSRYCSYKNVSVQFVFWSLGPLSKTCKLQNTAATLRSKSNGHFPRTQWSLVSVRLCL